MIETKKVACVTGTSLLTAMYGRNVTGINRPVEADITKVNNKDYRSKKTLHSCVYKGWWLYLPM